MVSRVIPVDPFELIIFGGTGDLARRKILPGLFRRFCAGQMPREARIIGSARADLDGAAYCQMVADAIREFGGKTLAECDDLPAFLERLDYVSTDAKGDRGWAELASKVHKEVINAFYFSVAPSLFGDIAERLKAHNMADDSSRIVVEKPFGRDLATAEELNGVLAGYFKETQIYRIDHYLGKETVQNLMALRFGNVMFEPLWNSHYIDHIQITVAETVAVGGRGAYYYDKSGAMRDMVQNHLMQLLCLIAMEPPAQFSPDAVRDEKLKVIRALQPVLPHEIVRGQYDAHGEEPSYREEAGNERSFTESFIAMKTQIANFRWSGVPFYLRTGKKLSTRASEIAVVFKALPHSIFKDNDPGRNVLSIQLQPNEGITMDMTIKEPGPGGMRLVNVPLDMTFADALGPDAEEVPDAYERLVMDVIRGNQTLFMRGDEVEAAWAWTDPIIEGWQARSDVPKPYDAYSMGPVDSDALMQRDNRTWREVKG